MHKGVIILTEAESRTNAIANVEQFLEEYGNGNVWDWYQIGGRWHNALAPEDKLVEYHDFARELFKKEDSPGEKLIFQKTIDKYKPELKAKWDELGLKGVDPFNFNQYLMDDNEDSYNAMPLTDCFTTVKQWMNDLEVEKSKSWDQMLEAKKEEDLEGSSHGMSGYYANKYSNHYYGDFSFDSNVYNSTEYEGETMPEDIKAYWAVMVDMHN